MIPEGPVATPTERNLIRALAWRFQAEIRHEAQRGFSRLRRVKADLPEFVLDWTTGEAIDAQTVFAALLRRRMLKRYGVTIDLSPEVGWGTETDWAQFEAAAASWLEKQIAEPIEASRAKAGAKRGAEVKKMIERRLKDVGWPVVSVGRGLSVSQIDLGNFFVHSYFSADRAGFSYWQDIGLSGADRATIRESYLSMFGVSGQTEFRNLADFDLGEMAIFVVDEAIRLLGYIRTAV